jgi:hypothetical protein
MKPPEIIRNTPPCLIPKELFKEEKMNKYWDILVDKPNHNYFGKDDLENYFLIYAKPENVDSIHEITVTYNQLQQLFPERNNAICINVYDEGLTILVLKERLISYAGYITYATKEDVLYHLTHLAQQFFEDSASITFFYQQLPAPVLRLLNQYYEMNKL